MESAKGRDQGLLVAAAAAFGAYFCMYAFRKPFTAATFDGREVFGLGLKSALVVSQLVGYMLSKFLGIWLVSGAARRRRGAAILGLIAIAELALVGFAFSPPRLQVVFMFLNGLPLGMIFGLVVSYLEGRRHTEALAAALTASFIVSSGVVKSVGRWMVQGLGVSESLMPMLVGLLFTPALLASVWTLSRTPPPDDEDLRRRRVRPVMDRELRGQFLAAYGPGLALLVLIYAALTVVRTVRDDFGVEIWRELGVDHEPSIFARTETLIAVVATGINALAFMIPGNRAAFRASLGLTAGAFVLVGASVSSLDAGLATPFAFMAASGLGLYLPYAAFHTTVFERLIAAAKVPCNLAFLMYLADSMGYLLYAAVVVGRTLLAGSAPVLPFFRYSLLIAAACSIVAVLGATLFFERRLGEGGDEDEGRGEASLAAAAEAAS